MVLRTFAFIAFLTSTLVCSGQIKNECEHIAKVTKQLKENHVSPPMDEKMGKNVMKEFFRLIDPHAIYFAQTEISPILSAPFTINGTGSQFCSIVKELELLAEAKFQKVDLHITSFLKNRLNYFVIDSTVDSRDSEFAQTEMLQKQKLERWIKYQVLDRMLKESDSAVASELLKFEALSREKLLAKEKKRFHKIVGNKKDLHHYVVTILLKAIASSFDPHTTYFSNEEMMDFQNGLSSSVLSFGLDFSEDERGEVAISSVIPGGGAWDSNEIHEGDVILSIKWNDKEKIDARDFSHEELKQKLELNSNRTAEITVRKKDGTQVIVKLQKTNLESDENNVDGMLLTGKRKIGYISLPAFYTNWDESNKKGCAADVASELVKLKKDNIEGLILDLRFNGGGSTKEAIDLAGIFINVGPLMVMQLKGQPLFTVKETTPGTIYQGPLLILVNGLSASASELITAALQDHKRAIVVGSPTFGKASGQSILPVVDKDTLGYIKVTNTKLFRITGKSYQQIGVQPDIHLPDFTKFLEYNERMFSNSFLNDSVVKKTYYTQLSQPSISVLKERSLQRTSKTLFFQKNLNTQSISLGTTPLHINTFIRHHISITEFYEKLIDFQQEEPVFKVSHNRFNDSLLQVDASRKERSDWLSKEIEESSYLREAYAILTDYIELEKK
jgi:carboxyl-terminal processing protease